MLRLGIIEESLENKDILEILKPYFISQYIENVKECSSICFCGKCGNT